MTSMRSQIILASASPRRAEILRNAGIDFEVVVSPAEEPERKPAGIPTELWPTCLAYMKASAVRGKLETQNSKRKTQNAKLKGVVILAADTIVVLNDRILNKPRDRAHARAMLCALSGKVHTVITGICLLRGGDLRLSRAVATCKFKKLSAPQLDAYLESGLWQGKAGAYGIQDAPEGDGFVTLLSGEITTVMGLPVALVRQELFALRCNAAKHGTGK